MQKLSYIEFIYTSRSDYFEYLQNTITLVNLNLR